MHKYLITFEPDTNPNSDISVAIRSELEDLSYLKQVQIFPFQLAIQSRLSIDGLFQRLNPIARGKRIFIVEFSEWATNEPRSTSLLKGRDY